MNVGVFILYAQGMPAVSVEGKDLFNNLKIDNFCNSVRVSLEILLKDTPPQLMRRTWEAGILIQYSKILEPKEKEAKFFNESKQFEVFVKWLKTTLEAYIEKKPEQKILGLNGLPIKHND